MSQCIVGNGHIGIPSLEQNDRQMNDLVRFFLMVLGCKHTERQASVASEASDFCNGSGTNLERQGKCHYRLSLVTLPLPLLLPLDTPLGAPLDARCGYAFRSWNLQLLDCCDIKPF